MIKYRHLIGSLNASLLLCTTLTAADLETPSRPEDSLPQLAMILNTARDNAPSLVEEDYLRKESDERLKQAQSDYYPSLDIAANLGIEQQYRQEDEDTSNLGLTYSARLTRPLYHWGAIEARIEQARIDNDKKALNYLQNTQSILRRIRSDYLTLLLNNVSLKNERIRRKILENDLERLKLDFDSGNISELNYHIKELDLQNSLLQIKRIERDQDRIITGFKQNAGWIEPLNTEQDIPAPNLDNIQRWIDSEAAAQTSAWAEQSYAGQLAQYEIKQQEEELTVINARQRPLLNFTASASQDQSNTSTQNNVDTFTLFAGFSVSWNIFDGYRTKHQKYEPA
jgi:Outer membrane protein